MEHHRRMTPEVVLCQTRRTATQRPTGSPAGATGVRKGVGTLMHALLVLALTPSFAAAPLIPTLAPVARDPDVIGVQGVEIHLPWGDAGHVDLRLPETLACDLGLLFIDHERADMPPVARVDRLPDWQRDEGTGALSYELQLPNGVSFGAMATPADGRVEFEFWIRNDTGKALRGLSTQFCLVETAALPFCQGDLTRTFIRSGGRWLALADTTHEVMNPERGPWIITGVGNDGMPAHAQLEGCWYCCPERADSAVIATTDPDGKRVIALSWDRGVSLMSNGWIPCLHCDPQWPECPAGDTVCLRGRLDILDTGLDGLWSLLEARSVDAEAR